jgi:hypothetical protein
MKASKSNITEGKQNSTIQSKAKNQGNEGSILQAYKKGTSQLASAEEEEPVQGKFETTQLNSDEEEVEPAPIQQKEDPGGTSIQFKRLIAGIQTMDTSFKEVADHVKELRPKAYAKSDDASHPAHGGNLEKHRDAGESREEALTKMYNSAKGAKKDEQQTKLDAIDPSVPSNQAKIAQLQTKNNTGLPDNLKSGVENLSGHKLDDVKVHYNSDKPASLQAHAYAQGTDIHIGPGQEKHLPHEAWHVAQQKQGRVKPTTQMKGKTLVNDDVGLEKEADVMGMKAVQMQSKDSQEPAQLKKNSSGSVAQLKTAIHITPQTLKQTYGDGQKTEGVVGHKMTSRIDPKDGVKGSSPGSGNAYTMYADLNHNYDDLFIKGHLLNANLGGLGIVENLFPITSVANHDHSSSVEENVKQAVIEGNDFGANYEVHYNVTATPETNNQFVDNPKAKLDCYAEKVPKDGVSKREPIVNTTIQSIPGAKESKNDRLSRLNFGSSGSSMGSIKTGKAEEITDPTLINKSLKKADLSIKSGIVDKVIERNGKLNSMIFK